MANLFIVSGPSGVGKSSLCQRVVNSTPNLHLSVSYTTRQKRPNEREGVSYHFTDAEDFARKESEGFFLESKQVYNYRYGTSKQWVEEQLKSHDILLEIDWKGACAVKEQLPEAVLCFLVPPTLKDLKQRLMQRQQDSPELIQSRFEQAEFDLQQYPHFDYIIINEHLEEAVKDLQNIIMCYRLKKGEQLKHWSLQRNDEVF